MITASSPGLSFNLDAPPVEAPPECVDVIMWALAREYLERHPPECERCEPVAGEPCAGRALAYAGLATACDVEKADSAYWRHLTELRRRENALASGLSTDLAGTVARADRIVATHVADTAGRCTACFAELGFWTPYPCSTRRWADRTHVIASYEGTS